MVQLLRLFLVLSLLTASVEVVAQAPAAIPALSSHVVDQINLLTATERSQLDQTLHRYETRTGSQIAVLLIATTAPDSIEQYSIRVAEAWKLGRKNVDDGVILLVAKDNPKNLHRLRIEAGRGVQGSLTDLQSKRILQEVIAPFFQRNDFAGGLTAGIDAITTLLDREQLPAPPGTPVPAASGTLSTALPFLLFIAFIALSVWLRSRRGGGDFSQVGWGRSAGVILGSSIGNGHSGSSIGTSSGGGMTGGGGSFDGGGASGDW